MAAAEYRDRSADSETTLGALQVFPASVEKENSVFSWFWPNLPSPQESTIVEGRGPQRIDLLRVGRLAT
jgi:hypothetical protein